MSGNSNTCGRDCLFPFAGRTNLFGKLQTKVWYTISVAIKLTEELRTNVNTDLVTGAFATKSQATQLRFLERQLDCFLPEG